MDKTPLVSVCMITYKHEQYIAEAIESVLMQNTDFPIELIIGEDAGPDSTRSICEAYQAKYPGIIRLLPPEKNMGFAKNFIRTLFAAKGKYIALLDGDDYWTDPAKLQKQVNFLEKNEAYNLIFHNVHLLKYGQMDGLVYPSDRKQVISIADILNHDYTQTCSIMFRSEPLSKIPVAEAAQWIYNDITLFSLILSNGTLGRYLPEVMATYRVHEGGVWSMVDIRKKYFMSRIAEDIIIEKYYPTDSLKRLITKREAVFYRYYSIELVKKREFGLMFSTSFRFLQWSAIHLMTKIRQPVAPKNDRPQPAIPA